MFQAAVAYNTHDPNARAGVVILRKIRHRCNVNQHFEMPINITKTAVTRRPYILTTAQMSGNGGGAAAAHSPGPPAPKARLIGWRETIDDSLPATVADFVATHGQVFLPESYFRELQTGTEMDTGDDVDDLTHCRAR